MAEYMSLTTYNSYRESYQAALAPTQKSRRRGECPKESQMPQVPPVYSVEPGARRVYHDNNQCAERYHIEPLDKRPGTGGRPRCDRCAKLEDEGR